MSRRREHFTNRNHDLWRERVASSTNTAAEPDTATQNDDDARSSKEPQSPSTTNDDTTDSNKTDSDKDTPSKEENASEPDALPSFLKGPKEAIEGVGQSTINFVEHIGNVAFMVGRTFVATLRPPYRVGLLLESMEEVGVGALFIVLLTGLFTGMVLSLQGVLAFKTFNAETLVGGSTAVALVRELGPVLTGLMVSGRSGSAMATTLGTMRVTEQIDAMEVMAVNSLQYLIAPRVIATLLMMPLLVLLFDLVGMIGAYLVAVPGMGVDGGIFISKIKNFVLPSDLTKGCIKGAAFGASIATLACYRGYYAAGGAKGVGEATTSAVVMGSISILVLNYCLDLVLW